MTRDLFAVANIVKISVAESFTSCTICVTVVLCLT